jgi:hypothetical protein
MKRTLLAAVAFALALQPARVEAQLFVGTPFDVEYQQFLSGSGQGGTYGVQVGPYTARFLANGTTARTTATPAFSVYCVDYLHYASNSTGLVNVTGVMSGANFANTRLGNFGDYQKSAYLSSLFDSWTTHQAALAAANVGVTFSKAEVWGGLHAAIWDVATGPAGLGSGDTALARNYFLNLASANGGSYDASGWYVLSERDVALSDGRSGQEFLMRREVAVPEPATVLLMLTGMMLLLVVGRMRREELI